MADQHEASRTTYEQFLEFERLMKVFPKRGGQGMNPTPLGFCAFALTLFVYSFYVCGATVPMGTSPAPAMGLALFYGGLIQLIAGLLEFRLGNNFYALTFCSYAGYWLGLASLYVNGSFSFTGYITDQTVLEKAFGVFYLGWAIFTLCMLISSLQTNATLGVFFFFFFLMLTYILLCAGYFLIGDYNILRAGGAFGIFTSIIAWVLGFDNLLAIRDNS